jgi:hypothetical protein
MRDVPVPSPEITSDSYLNKIRLIFREVALTNAKAVQVGANTEGTGEIYA